MSDMELMEIEFTETTVETDNVWLNLAINFGVTIAGVLAGNAICWGVGKIADAIKGKKQEQEIIDVEECEEDECEAEEEPISEVQGEPTVEG